MIGLLRAAVSKLLEIAVLAVHRRSHVDIV